MERLGTTDLADDDAAGDAFDLSAGSSR